MGVASTNSAPPGKDHFDLVENLTDAASQLTQSILQFITAALFATGPAISVDTDLTLLPLKHTR